MTNLAKQTGGLFILLAVALTACDGGDDPVELELIGSWTNNYDGTEIITADTWDNGYSVLTVSSYDNDDNWVVVRSPADDAYTPNEYSKYVWTDVAGGIVYYCTVSFGLETQEEAETSANNSDPSAPSDGGCNGFAWTELSAN